MTVTGHRPAGGNLKKVLALVIFAGLLMTGCGSKSAQTAATPSASETAGLVSGVTVPDVVGKRLDNATEELKGLGLKVEATDTAAGKSIFVESNWQVTTQDVSPGATVAKSSRISLGVVHLTDATPTPTPTPTAAPVVAPPAAVVAPPVVVPVPAAPRASSGCTGGTGSAGGSRAVPLHFAQLRRLRTAPLQGPRVLRPSTGAHRGTVSTSTATVTESAAISRQ